MLSFTTLLSFRYSCQSRPLTICYFSLQLDISTVAAGGGSKLFFRSGMFIVGPDSAGAQPGPVCYDKGGTELTITDANLVLGRILPDFFPKIFGPKNDQPLNKAKTMTLFEKMTEEINAFLKEQKDPKRMSVEEVAMGFVRVANEAMCRPIRAITQVCVSPSRDVCIFPV